MKKSHLTILFIFVLVLQTYGSVGSETRGRDFVSSIGAVGIALAVVLSWDRNRSIGWAILHGVLNWIYVVYFAITRKPEKRERREFNLDNKRKK